MDRSRLQRSDPNSVAVSSTLNARGSRLGVRSRSRDRGAGRRRVWTSMPVRSPVANQDEGLPLGIGERIPGSRIDKNSNIPATAASRRFTDAGASRSVGRPARSTELVKLFV